MYLKNLKCIVGLQRSEYLNYDRKIGTTLIKNLHHIEYKMVGKLISKQNTSQLKWKNKGRV